MSQDNLEENLETLEEEVENQEPEVQLDENGNELVTEVKTDDKPEVKRESRADKYAKLEKSYNELRSFSDRRYNESMKQMKELDEQLKFFAPYKEALAKAIEEKKQAELQELYKTNPIEAQRRIAEDAAKAQEAALNAKYGPMQEQIERAKSEEFVGQTINYLSETYGQQMFEAAREPMGAILSEVAENAGKDAADLLARNPDALFQMAFGRVALEQIRKINNGKKVSTNNQNRATQFANGVAKPTTSAQRQSTSYDKMSDEELERLHFESIAKQTRR